jgi:peptidoglycan/LPS O-acetylase OafA/YrhL
LTVIFFHNTSPPIFSLLSRDTPIGRVVLGLYDAAFNGQAAVLAFFVISGFCIHFPYASGRTFYTVPFLLARAVRILVPTGAYLLLLRAVPYTEPALKILLWSIWCELIYYALYPGLRLLFAKTSVFFVLLSSYAAASAAVVYTLTTQEWPGLFGAGNLTWLAGMPCWILGCHLAGRFSTVGIAPVAATTVWTYRIGAASLGFVSYLAMLHLHVSFLISLHFFAVFSYFWIQSELNWHLNKPANQLFERLGRLTFSVYLMHALAKCVWESVTPATGLFMWAVEVGFVLLVSAVFYVLIERPSHLLARILSRRTKDFEMPTVPATTSGA